MKLIEIFAKFPEIKFCIIKNNITSYYLLRELDPTIDSDSYKEYMQNEFVSQHIADNILVTSSEKAIRDITYWRNVFYENIALYWGLQVITKEEFEDTKSIIYTPIIGTIGFNYVNILNNLACISYDLDYAFWGRGIINKAIEIICNFANEKLKISKIEATVVKKNNNSIRVLEKNNFYLLKSIKDHEYIKGKWTDSYVYLKNVI